MTSISNLQLRPVKPSDFKIYYQLVSNPQVARGAEFSPASSVESGRRLFRDDTKNARGWAVTLDHRMIGLISLYPTVGPDYGPDETNLELADMMLPKYQNHSYMTQALGMLIKHLKRSANVNRLTALVSETNRASRKVLVRNGFKNYRSVLDLNSDHENLVYQLNLR